MLIIAIFFLFNLNTFSKSIRDYGHFKSKTIFTSPFCKDNCEPQDYDKMKIDKTKLRKDLERVILDPLVNELIVSSFSITDLSFSEILCKALSLGKKVKVLVNYSSKSQAYKKLESCQTRKMSLVRLGVENDFSLYHIKFILTKSLNRKWDHLVITSGNFSSGLYKHYENWNFFEISQESRLYQEHLCTASVLLRRPKTRKRFIKKIKSCFSKITPKEKESDFAFHLLPGDGKAFLNKILDKIKKDPYLVLSTHHFSFKPIFDQLLHNPRHRIITDLSHFLNSKGLASFKTSSYESLLLRKLKSRGLQVDYYKNKPELNQLYHNKFILSHDSIILGSSNFTQAGMGESTYFSTVTGTTFVKEKMNSYKSNFENMYEIKILNVVNSFKKMTSALDHFKKTDFQKRYLRSGF